MRLWKHIVMLAVLAVVIAGCAAMGGKSDADLVCETMTQMDAAMSTGDVDAVMAFYSEDYEARGREGTTMGKEDLREMYERWLPRMAERAAEEGSERRTDMSQAVPQVDGDTATFGPVIRQRGRGPRAMQYNLKKEADGVWRIVGRERLETKE
jgi:ketosteroid isomerase-like protein